MDEKKDTNEEYPESTVKTIVTEEKTGENKEIAKEETHSGVAQKDAISEGAKSGHVKDIWTKTLDSLNIDIRKKANLQQLDKEYAWLAELDEMNLETFFFISKVQYVAINNRCQKYLSDLSSNDSMTQFRTEFSSLFQKFRTAFTGSHRIFNKLKEIRVHKNINEKETRQLKIKLESETRKIDELQTCLQNAEANLSKMEKEKLNLQNLFNELKEYKANKTWEQKEQPELITKAVVRDDDEAHKKIVELEGKLELLGNEAEFIRQREIKYQNKIQQAFNKNMSLEKELKSVKFELHKQTTRAEKAEGKILEKNDELRSKDVSIETLTEERNQVKAELGKAKEEARSQLKNYKKYQKDLDSTTQTIEKLRRDLDVREDRIKLIGSQKDSIELELANKQAEVFTLKGDIANIVKEKNYLTRRISVLEQRITDEEIQLHSAQNQNASQKKELDLLVKELGETDSKRRELTKQNNALSESVLRHDQIITTLQAEAKIQADKCDHLEDNLEKSMMFTNVLQGNIQRLESARARQMKEIVDLNRNISDFREEITRLDLHISEMKTTEEKLRKQLADEQEKYKRTAEDERHARRLLAESRREVEQLKEEQTGLQKHVKQLQIMYDNLDEGCKKLNLNLKHITEESRNLKELYKQGLKSTEALASKLKRKEDQEQIMMKNIAASENLVHTLKSKTKNLLEEINVRNTKLLEKEREISDLKERIRLLQEDNSTLDISVNNRINDIKLLKIQLAQVIRSNAVINKEVEHMEIARGQIAESQNKLIQEKIKSKTLEQEALRPVNLHRWRILEGIDPERSQLVAKNQSLQKKLIKRSKQLDNKEVELQEKDRLAQELQEQLRRRSETDIQEQLWACKKELSARMERLKCLTAENNMFQDLCNKYKYEVTTLKNQLRDYKVNVLDTRPIRPIKKSKSF